MNTLYLVIYAQSNMGVVRIAFVAVFFSSSSFLSEARKTNISIYPFRKEREASLICLQRAKRGGGRVSRRARKRERCCSLITIQCSRSLSFGGGKNGVITR